MERISWGEKWAQAALSTRRLKLPCFRLP